MAILQNKNSSNVSNETRETEGIKLSIQQREIAQHFNFTHPWHSINHEIVICIIAPLPFVLIDESLKF